MNIILIGFKSCGKTSVGKELDPNFIDTDLLIEQNYVAHHSRDLSCYEIYYKHGQNYFRELEHKVINALNVVDNRVISTGGGSLLLEDNVNKLQQLGDLVYLNTPAKILFERIMTLHRKPAFLSNDVDPWQEFNLIYQQRELIYKSLASREILTQNKSIYEIAAEIRGIYGK